MAELAILVPTLNRADRLKALAENIEAATTVRHRVYFIAEESDKETLTALCAIPAVHVIGDYGSCAVAYNAGYDASTEPYAFLANDDLEFPDGWEYPAIDLCRDEAPIVGVNEGHGRMTCFAMVRRSFIEEHSGVYDQPGTLVHPYKSQFVDTELAEYAKHRGVWAEAHEGGVIHRHHDFGDCDPNHPNYVKARATHDEDRATYEARKAEWLATSPF